MNRRLDHLEPGSGEARKEGHPRAWLLCMAPLLLILGAFFRDFSMNESGFQARTAPALQPLPETPLVIDRPGSIMNGPPTSTQDASRSATLPPEATPYPTLYPTRDLIQAHLSWYWPPYGGMNCDVECEHLANGDDWQKWEGKGLACPSRYPLGTVFVIMGEEWQCVDRGEAIVVNKDGTIWLDMLVYGMPYGMAWGSVRTVEIRRK